MPAPPRVLVLTNMWPTAEAPSRGGFVEEQVTDLQRLAPDWGWEVMVVDGREGRRRYLQAAVALRDRARGTDLIHAHYGLTGAVATTQSRVPVVITYHGSDVYLPVQRILSRWAGRRADRRIFVSERLRERSGLPGGEVIPCGVDLERFRPGDRAEARRRLGVPDDAAVIVFPGDPARPEKGHPVFRAVLDRLSIEPGREVRELPLEGLAHDEVPLRLQAADVVLQTSRYEGAGTVAKEAVACGVPVVSTPVGDVEQVVEGLPGCAVTAGSPGALAAAVERALEDRPAWDGRERLRELGLDRPSAARRVLAVYRAVLDADRGHARPG